MAVLQMQRINICAMKKNRKAILERLQELGAMEIDIHLEDDSQYVRMDVANSRATFERQAQTADRALEILNQYVPEKTGMLSSLAGKPLIDRELFEKAARSQDNYIETARQIVSLEKKVSENRANISKLQNQREALTPWMGLPVPLTFQGTRKTTAFIGTIPGSMTEEDVYRTIFTNASETEAVDVEIISSDKDYTYLAVICLTGEARSVEEALRTVGFAKPANMANKIPAEYCREIESGIESCEKEILGLENQIKDCAGSRQDLRLVSDYYRIRADKYEILGQIPQTVNTFALSGYVPACRAESIVKEFTEKYDAVVEIEEIGEEEEPPVLLKNNRFASSIEGVLASFGLPKKGEIDPSMITAVFYVFLFGLMLSDAAYGLIMVLVCGAALVKFPRMSESLQKSIRLFFWCGVSTLVWGVLFGGYFGDVVDVVSETFFGHKVSIPALWFVPLNDPMKLLLWSLAFGVIHLFTGLALKGYMCLRDKHYVDFVCDCVLWFVLLIGLLGMLIPSDLFAGIAGQKIVFPAAVSTAAKWMAIVGAIGILFMSGRSNKNFVVRIALGAYDLYGLTSWLSDVLSYSRLLALGLATGVIASVVNQMGSMMGGGVAGAILFIVVFLIGHTFNMAINLLGAYVHSNRLEYVEFFGKFYEGGGKPFTPFNLKTKYVDIKEEK